MGGYLTRSRQRARLDSSVFPARDVSRVRVELGHDPPSFLGHLTWPSPRAPPPVRRAGEDFSSLTHSAHSLTHQERGAADGFRERRLEPRGLSGPSVPRASRSVGLELLELLELLAGLAALA